MNVMYLGFSWFITWQTRPRLNTQGVNWDTLVIQTEKKTTSLSIASLLRWDMQVYWLEKMVISNREDSDFMEYQGESYGILRICMHMNIYIYIHIQALD